MFSCQLSVIKSSPFTALQTVAGFISRAGGWLLGNWQHYNKSPCSGTKMIWHKPPFWRALQLGQAGAAVHGMNFTSRVNSGTGVAAVVLGSTNRRVSHEWGQWFRKNKLPWETSWVQIHRSESYHTSYELCYLYLAQLPISLFFSFSICKIGAMMEYNPRVVLRIKLENTYRRTCARHIVRNQ